MKRKFICIVCPNSCRVDVEYDGERILDIHGVECRKGRDYVMNEIRHPMRMLTGSVNVRNGELPLVSVKTSAPIPKQALRDVAALTHRLEVEAPVNIGQVIAENVLNLHIDLLATRHVRRA